MSGLIINPYAFATAGGCENVGIVSVNAEAAQGGIDLQYGTEYEVGASAISVCKLRIYTGAGHGTETEQVYLWRVTDETLLAEKAIVRVPGAWAEALLDAPVELAAGSRFIVSCWANGTARTIVNATSSNSVTLNAAIASAVHIRAQGAEPFDGFPTYTSTNTKVRGICDVGFS